MSTIWSSDNMLTVTDLDHGDMMPRRLLRFPLQIQSESRVKLEEISKTEEVPEKYLALSHRWGGEESFRTTTENVEAMRSEGVAFKDLPLTYQDAIQVSAKLGFGLLWVDSYCIIQNDSEDWKYEARRMSLIYANSCMTIAAMDSVDNQGGLFISDMNDAERQSLNSRAWVMQEETMSPRSLNFTKNTLYWECREADASLTEPQLIRRCSGQYDIDRIPDHPKELFAYFRDFRLPSVTYGEYQAEFVAINTDLIGEFAEYEPLLRAWWKMVNLYSSRALSHGQDKFMAFNGIANMSIRWTYLKNTFGLWFHYLQFELLWHVDLDGPEAKSAPSFRVPTWSWANLDNGRIRNRYYEWLPAIPVLVFKREIETSVGTSFDQTLPIPAWRTEKYHSLGLKADLRKAEVTSQIGDDGRTKCTIKVDPVGRYSDAEENTFYPDVASSFTPGNTFIVYCAHMLHYNKGVDGMKRYFDLHIVITQVAKSKVSVQEHTEWTATADLMDERRMRRVGCMETAYDEMRSNDAIYEDAMWKWFKLV